MSNVLYTVFSISDDDGNTQFIGLTSRFLHGYVVNVRAKSKAALAYPHNATARARIEFLATCKLENVRLELQTTDLNEAKNLRAALIEQHDTLNSRRTLSIRPANPDGTGVKHSMHLRARIKHRGLDETAISFKLKPGPIAAGDVKLFTPRRKNKRAT